jgi:hypothetical protein
MYIKISYYSDGSGKPELVFYPRGNPEDDNEITYEALLSQALQDKADGKEVEIYKVLTLSGVPKVVFGGYDL